MDRHLPRRQWYKRQLPYTLKIFTNLFQKGTLMGMNEPKSMGGVRHRCTAVAACTKPQDKQKRLQCTVGAASGSKGCFVFRKIDPQKRGC
jgi:hypothetical protein